KAGFDDVDAQTGELSRDSQLLCRLHRATRRLLAITERGVEDAHLIVRHRRRFELCHIVPAKVWVTAQACKRTEGSPGRAKGPKHNGPSRGSCERGRLVRLVRLGGPSSHARKPPAKKAEGVAKEEAAGAEHCANTSTIAPSPEESIRPRALESIRNPVRRSEM